MRSTKKYIVLNEILSDLYMFVSDLHKVHALCTVDVKDMVVINTTYWSVYLAELPCSRV